VEVEVEAGGQVCWQGLIHRQGLKLLPELIMEVAELHATT
jgi:hypothetical protein